MFQMGCRFGFLEDNCMFQIDENSFAQIQKECCWFNFPRFKKLPDVDSNVDVMLDAAIWRNDIYLQRHIFAMIFGAFGYSVDLNRAFSIVMIKLGQIEKQEPEDKSTDNPKYISWLERFAQYNILLGTVAAYWGEYRLASAMFMKGLKTHAINLFMPYCDFIRYVLSKVPEYSVGDASYDGCGFSPDEPMGSTECNGGKLDEHAAEMLISALAGNNGETILFYFDVQEYGSIERLTPTKSDKFYNCIDVYEAFVVDRDLTLMKIKFYFNRYFTPGSRGYVKVPKGFHLDPLSEAAKVFRVVK